MTAKVTSIKWLDSHRWGVRAFKPGYRAMHNDFKFKRGWNVCPDWSNSPRCGGGFHLMTPEYHGFGPSGSVLALVEWRGESVALHDKIKVRELRVVTCSVRIIEVALERCGIHVAQDGDTVNVGLNVVLRGRPSITQRGGVVCTYGTSAPRITLNGGAVWTYGTSAPRIALSGGALSGGTVYTCETSAPRITLNGRRRGRREEG